MNDDNDPDSDSKFPRRITTPWGKKMYALLFTNRVRSAQINAICKRAAKDSVDPQVHGPGSPGARLSTDISMLHEAVQTMEPLCIKEHRDSGLALLHRLAYTPAGRRRHTKMADEFTEADLRTLASACNITWVDIHYEFGSYNRCRAYPIYEVCSDGSSFKYYYLPWQSGGGFEIIEHS